MLQHMNFIVFQFIVNFKTNSRVEKRVFGSYFPGVRGGLIKCFIFSIFFKSDSVQSVLTRFPHKANYISSLNQSLPPIYSYKSLTSLKNIYFPSKLRLIRDGKSFFSLLSFLSGFIFESMTSLIILTIYQKCSER